MPSTDTGIIDFAFHPPVGVMSPHLDYHGPYSGNVTVDVYSTVPGPTYSDKFVSASYGIILRPSGVIPAGWGSRLGWSDALSVYVEDIYDERMCQVVVQHQMNGGAWLSTQIKDVYTIAENILWEVALPGRIGLYVAPGLAFDLYFLEVF